MGKEEVVVGNDENEYEFIACFDFSPPFLDSPCFFFGFRRRWAQGSSFSFE